MGRHSSAGLHDPSFERDSCGFGLIGNLDDDPSHWVVETAIAALARLTHLGAVAADGKTGLATGGSEQQGGRRQFSFQPATAGDRRNRPGNRSETDQDGTQACRCRWTPAPGTGSGGLNHIGVVVNDLDAAEKRILANTARGMRRPCPHAPCVRPSRSRPASGSFSRKVRIIVSWFAPGCSGSD